MLTYIWTNKCDFILSTMICDTPAGKKMDFVSLGADLRYKVGEFILSV